MHTRIVGYKKYLERKVQGFVLECDWSTRVGRHAGRECVVMQ